MEDRENGEDIFIEQCTLVEKPVVVIDFGIKL
jgi:hypothetical protein